MKTIKRVKIKFDKLLHDTGKAILVRIGNNQYWLAYYMCDNLVINKKLKGSVSISIEVCKNKDIPYNNDDADLIITKHTPKRIKSDKLIIDKELLR